MDDFRVGFDAMGTVLTVAMRFTHSLRVIHYLRRTDGTLPWRADCHPGHERELGSRHRLHLGPGENYRVAALPATLTSIAERIVATHLGLK